MQEYKPKEKINGVKYNAYCNKIEFILFTGCDSEFKAASTYLRNPSVESHVKANTATSLKPNIAIGSFAGGPIALIQRSTEKNMKQFINDIMDIFPVAKYFISVGTGFGFQQKEMKVGDVFISSGLIAVDEYSVSIAGSTAHINVQSHHQIQTIELLQRIFCVDTSVEQNFRVTKDCTADYQVSKIVSSVSMAEDTRLYNKTSITVHPSVVGGDISGRELLQWQNDGKISGFIVIKSVIGYVDGRKSDVWKFTGALAAVHYVEQKMIPYMGKLSINLRVCNDQYLRYNLHYQFSVV